MSEGRVKKRLVVHPEEAEIVRRIYDYYIMGMGGKAIAERLNHEGFQYRGKPGCNPIMADGIYLSIKTDR